MIDLEDLPVVGGLFAGGQIFADLLVNNGELMAWILAHLAEIVGVLSLLNRLGGYFGWIPEGIVSDLLMVALVALLLIRVAKLVTPNDS